MAQIEDKREKNKQNKNRVIVGGGGWGVGEKIRPNK
jgi:hypothetical protein